MHKHLVNFQSLRHFRYYTHLLRMFLEKNKTEFPEAAFISTECKRMTMLIFINKIMSRVYSLIFNTSLPRVLKEMKRINKSQEGKVVTKSIAKRINNSQEGKVVTKSIVKSDFCGFDQTIIKRNYCTYHLRDHIWNQVELHFH